MRQLFASDNDYKDQEAVEEAHPWFAVIHEVEGGWQVFESAADAETWENQK
tara:strand:+ start:481 stop:633 length:153 start_codon:yes stop_codon:yes gene_type:complete